MLRRIGTPRFIKRIASWHLLPPLVLAALSISTMVFFDRPLIRGDGVAYLAWVDTLVLDRDIRFDNQLERFRGINSYQIVWNEHTQRLVNIFPFGAAFLQAPFYGLGHFFAIQNWGDVNPDYFKRLQGVALPYSFWLMIGANLMALWTLVLVWLIGRRLCGGWTAALASWGFFVGTPLFFYSTISPLNSHNPGAFLATVFVSLLIQCTGAFQDLQRVEKEPRSSRFWDLFRWIALGLSAGLMVLVRWQLLLIAAPAWGLLIWQRRWKGLLLATITAAVSLLPLPLIWNQLFGNYVVVPYTAVSGQAFLQFPAQSLWVLIETLRHSPLLLLSMIGIPFLWRLDRPWAVLAVAMIGAQILVNGAALDWGAGDTYGMRRMTELFPVYVLLACALFGNWPSKEQARGWTSWLRPSASRSLLLALILYSFLYIFSFISFTWTNPERLPIAEPERMISYFLYQNDRWNVLAAVLREHVGPTAWAMPGP